MQNQNELWVKCALGRVLGEILRLEKRIDPEMVQCSDADIYGLINGLENVTERFFPDTNNLNSVIVTKEDYTLVCDVLDEFYDNPDSFKGCYDIEDKLGERYDRTKTLKIITHLNLDGAYDNLISKMDSSGSPTELRTFDVSKDRL